jgi:hypothetical protein
VVLVYCGLSWTPEILWGGQRCGHSEGKVTIWTILSLLLPPAYPNESNETRVRIELMFVFYSHDVTASVEDPKFERHLALTSKPTD